MVSQSVLALLVVVALVALTSAQTVEDRAVAAIVGAFVADAAAMPLHWIYDVVCHLKKQHQFLWSNFIFFFGEEIRSLFLFL